MGIRHVPKPVLICFVIGFCLGASTMSTAYWMTAHGIWRSEPAWLFLLCPASITLMGLPYDSQPPTLPEYATLVLVVALFNGVLFGGVGELIGFSQRKLQQWSGRAKAL